MAVNQVATLGVKVDPRQAIQGANRAKRAITGIGKTASNVKSRIMSMQGALVGLGAGAVLKSIITTASSVESLRVRLKFLTGSVEDASTAFKVMNEFASKVPFSLEDIEKASPLLLTVAEDVGELNELLSITGDIAAISGLSFDKTAEQLQRAMASGIASADLFRERGVAAFLGFEQGVQMSGAKTTAHIKKIFREGITTAKGATDELADTFMGQTSMKQDAWRELKLAIADAGVFEMASKVVLKLTAILKDEKTIENMKAFGAGITSIGTAIGSVINLLLGLPPWVLEVGIVMAFLGGKKAKLAVVGMVAIAKGIDAVTQAIQSFNAQDEMKEFNGLENGGEAGADFTDFRTNPNIRNSGRNREMAEALFGIGVDDGRRAGDQLMQQQKLVYLGFLSNQRRVTKELTDENKKYIDSLKMVGVTLTPLQKLYQDEQVELKRIQDLYKTGVITNKQWANSTTEIAMAYMDAASRIKDARIQEQLQEFADGLSNSIEDSIMKMTQGLMSFKDVVKNVFQYVAAQVVRNQIANPLAQALSGIMTGALGGFALPAAPANLGKPLMQATGGNVQGGEPYIVGERGPELFSPMGSGTITPNHRMGGGQTINVSYSPNVNALDPITI